MTLVLNHVTRLKLQKTECKLTEKHSITTNYVNHFYTLSLNKSWLNELFEIFTTGKGATLTHILTFISIHSKYFPDSDWLKAQA